ncbi:hypothetical protein DEFDS_P090 (plasmid) [Deferribacter desulfuricans SSM1]|uniref:Uncharacterized protein n=1 Tax=Deferribacter desulfuricans (strain DSM 14783 / JCM 11476 / NBRC 101012 / SSM1) TaxID=639282 RepID=D3PES1_DEFDS|nr:hypothetical protein [Deferribacter desulfuricans]BAI81713.1 hypothetical protein DEFDS_P090 [Deferribacter desulfuricans SSM1]
MHYIICIDPDTKESAYSRILIDNKQKINIEVGVYDSQKKEFWLKLVENSYTNLPPIIVVENQYINIRKGNHKDIIGLLKTAFRFEFWFTDILNLKIHTVFPSSWQNFILNEYGYNLRTYKKNKINKQKLFEETALKFYRSINNNNELVNFNKNNLNDIIAALCITYYVIKQPFLFYN